MEQELALAWLSLHRCLLSGYWAEGHRILSPNGATVLSMYFCLALAGSCCNYWQEACLSERWPMLGYWQGRIPA